MIKWVDASKKLPESGSDVFFCKGNVFYKGWFDDFNNFDGSGYFYSDHAHNYTVDAEYWVLCERP